MRNNKMERYSECEAKAYVFENGDYTLSRSTAKKAIKNGEKMCLAVHVKGEGEWITSPIVSIDGKEVETQHHIYEMTGKAKPKKVTSCSFFIDSNGGIDGKNQFSFNSKQQMMKLLGYLDMQCPISAEVTFSDGTTHITHNVLSIDLVHKAFITTSYSRYKVLGNWHIW